MSVKWNWALEARVGPAASSTFVHSTQCGLNSRGRDNSVGVNKEEPVTVRGATAGISGFRDLSMLDVEANGTVSKRDLSGVISGCVIDDNYFIGDTEAFRGLADGAQSFREAVHLVVRGHDERDQVFDSCIGRVHSWALLFDKAHA